MAVLTKFGDFFPIYLKDYLEGNRVWITLSLKQKCYLS